MSVRGDVRFDFRGGVNTSYAADAIQSNEVSSAANMRLNKFGALVKRNGMRRTITSPPATGRTYQGVYYWKPNGYNPVMLAFSRPYLFSQAYNGASFTQLTSSMTGGSGSPSFQPFDTASYTHVYVADGANVWRHRGGTSSTSNITSLYGAPSGAERLAVYKQRLFVTDGTTTLYWSVVDDPEDWDSTNGAGSAPVGGKDSSPLVGLAPCGSSLLLFREDAIARYTGVISSEINIDKDSEGVSAEIGCIAAPTIVPFGQHVFFLSDRGPMAATEAGVVAIGTKIENQFDGRDWSDACAAHHRGAREIWLWSPGLGEGWTYNYRLDAWTGPHGTDADFNIYSAATAEDANGYETIIYGGGDDTYGWMYYGDDDGYGSKDDLARAGTGGTNVTGSVTLPTLTFGDPGTVKRLSRTQYITADLKTNGSLDVTFQGDGLTAQTQTLASTGDGVDEYQTRPGTHGRRIIMSMEDATSEPIEIHGVSLEADMGRRIA